MDTTIAKEILNSGSDSALNVETQKVKSGAIVVVGKYVLNGGFVGSKHPQHPHDGYDVMIVHLADGKEIGKTDIVDAVTVKDVFIKNNQRAYSQLTSREHPDDHLFMTDFWIESVTGFAFGHIKAVGTVTLVLRLFQFLVAYLLATMVTNTLRATNRFVLDWKDDAAQ